jgi:hypothetical protein
MDPQNLNTQPQTPNEPAPAVEDSSIPRKPIAPLQTFQTDIERFLKENEVSEKDLQVAELLKKRVGGPPIPTPPTPSLVGCDLAAVQR